MLHPPNVPIVASPNPPVVPDGGINNYGILNVGVVDGGAAVAIVAVAVAIGAVLYRGSIILAVDKSRTLTDDFRKIGIEVTNEMFEEVEHLGAVSQLTFTDTQRAVLFDVYRALSSPLPNQVPFDMND